MPIVNTQRWLVRERSNVTGLFADYGEGRFRPALSAPFCVLRERREDGSEVYVGQVTMYYCGEEEKRRTPVNDAWEEWRTRTNVWEIGGALTMIAVLLGWFIQAVIALIFSGATA